MATQTETLPDYVFWQADDVDAAFGADISRYIPRQDASAIERALRPEVKVVEALFYSGGKLADHGLCWKPEMAAHKPTLTLRALLSSFAPSHEAKIATAALALHHWCEAIGAESDAKATGA